MRIWHGSDPRCCLCDELGAYEMTNGEWWCVTHYERLQRLAEPHPVFAPRDYRGRSAAQGGFRS